MDNNEQDIFRNNLIDEINNLTSGIKERNLILDEITFAYWNDVMDAIITIQISIKTVKQSNIDPAQIRYVVEQMEKCAWELEVLHEKILKFRDVVI